SQGPQSPERSRVCANYPTCLEFRDKGGSRLDHQVSGQMDRLSLKSANGLHNLQQIAAIAGARTATFRVVPLVEVLDRVRALIHAQTLHDRVEDLVVHLADGRLDADLVANTAKERVVDQVLRIKVGREDDELFEGHLELLARGYRQE